jgi:hypothetical protein
MTYTVSIALGSSILLIRLEIVGENPRVLGIFALLELRSKKAQKTR